MGKKRTEMEQIFHYTILEIEHILVQAPKIFFQNPPKCDLYISKCNLEECLEIIS